MRVTMTTHALTRPLTYSAARALVDEAAPLPVAGGSRRSTIRLSLWTRIQLGTLTVGVWVIGAVIAVAAVAGLVALARTVIADPIGSLPWVVSLALAAVGMAVINEFDQRRRILRRARTILLARENGWDYTAETLAVPPARSMAIGTERRVLDLVRLRRAPRIELGVFQTKLDSGRSTAIIRQDYLALALPQKLPNIVLQAVPAGPRIGTAVAVPNGVDPEQLLRLEGDFDQHFRLYCPPGYERDALYLFTPDIMALFIDRAHGCSVEIVDNWLIVSGNEGRLRGSKPVLWESTLELISAVEIKLDQWARWRDDSKRRRAPRGVPRALARPRPDVAPGGARLRNQPPAKRLRRQLVTGAVVLGSVALVYAAIFIPLVIRDAH